ncbi:MAG: chloride channel protein [Myxococcales bacterium]|nr:chloride channel protein [Myxococcales bacterium]
MLLNHRVAAAIAGRDLPLLLLAVVVGVAGGYGAIAFRALIGLVNRLAFPDGITLQAIGAMPWYLVVLGPAIGGLVVGPMVYFLAREAKGHGVPEVIDACRSRGGRIRPRVAVVKILASAVSIGSGGSVGREGPIVQIGSAVGSSAGQLLGIQGERLRTLVAVGAAAGIAATFNAPIAGVFFAVEIILGRGSVRTFTPIVIGAVVATVITRAHLGNSPAFTVDPHDLVSLWELPLYVLLGALAALVGVAFTRGLYGLEDLWDRLPVPEYTRALFGGAVVGALALGLPQVMGVGYEVIEHLLRWSTHGIDGSPALWLLALLVAAKIFATGTTIGSGGSGGIFAPSLFIGACLGAAFGEVAGALMPAGTVASPSAYALVCMGAVVGATTHAPLTAILIVFELTNQHTIILPLMLACVIATVISVRLGRESIYTLKLSRRGAVAAGVGVMATTTVRAVCEPPPALLRRGMPLREASKLLFHGEGDQGYVLDEEGRLEGVVIAEDVTALVREGSDLRGRVVDGGLVRPPPATLAPDDTLERCIDLFSKHQVVELPVVEPEGRRLVARVTEGGILRFYNREVLHREAALRLGEGGEEPGEGGEGPGGARG